LLLVDVLFEDVAQHVGVNLPVVLERALVEMPSPTIEERKKPVECVVGDVDARVSLLEFVNFEQAAVEVGHLTQDRLEIRRALLLPQAFVKEPEKKVTVKAQKLVLPLPLQDHLEAVLKVPSIAIKESFLLNEIDEHQPVEHERGIPLPVGIDWDALDELQEAGVFLLELVVELLGD